MLGVGVDGPTGRSTDAPPGDALAGDLDQERAAWAVLGGVRGLGPVGFGVLLRRYGTGVAILREASTPGGTARLAASPRTGITTSMLEATEGLEHSVPSAVALAIADAAQDAPRILGRIRDLGLTIVTVDEPAYPSRLAAIEMPPHLLYVLGDPAVLNPRAAVAIVGTRRATDAGRAIAAQLATSLAGVGACVVSGLAVGIDGAAHAAAVHAAGRTVAVIGSGHGALYPRAHEGLAALIIKSGGAIVSELGPDVEPSRGTFPRRNRVISGLADATVVVEAPARSGALITASWALEQGRECFMVPGPIGAPASAGCLSFLREFPNAARIVAGIPQLIDDLGLADHLADTEVSSRSVAALADLGDAARRLGRELTKGRSTVDELVAATGWPVASVLAGLTLLERRGLALGVHGRFRPAGGLAGVDAAKPGQRPRGLVPRTADVPADQP
ncbi:MAG: DNA-protecting protein DprA [Chloroflexi bacterium]|nr:DNA-protecting protein DprA [Chloroflexota bacterium]